MRERDVYEIDKDRDREERESKRPVWRVTTGNPVELGDSRSSYVESSRARHVATITNVGPGIQHRPSGDFTDLVRYR